METRGLKLEPQPVFSGAQGDAATQSIGPKNGDGTTVAGGHPAVVEEVGENKDAVTGQRRVDLDCLSPVGRHGDALFGAGPDRVSRDMLRSSFQDHGFACNKPAWLIRRKA